MSSLSEHSDVWIIQTLSYLPEREFNKELVVLVSENGNSVFAVVDLNSDSRFLLDSVMEFPVKELLSLYQKASSIFETEYNSDHGVSLVFYRDSLGRDSIAARFKDQESIDGERVYLGRNSGKNTTFDFDISLNKDEFENLCIFLNGRDESSLLEILKNMRE